MHTTHFFVSIKKATMDWCKDYWLVCQDQQTQQASIIYVEQMQLAHGAWNDKLTGGIRNVHSCSVRWAACDSVVIGGLRRYLDNTCEGLLSFKNIIRECWNWHTSSAATTECGSQETTSVVKTICNEWGRNASLHSYTAYILCFREMILSPRLASVLSLQWC